MTESKLRRAAFAGLLLCAASSATAATYELTYAFSDAANSVLVANITGDLQADGDTVIVTALDNFTLTGVADTSGFRIASFDFSLGLSSEPRARLSLNGNGILDFLISKGSTAVGLSRDWVDEYLYINGANLPNSRGIQAFRYSLVEASIATVQLPASGLLLGGAFGALLLGRRRNGATA